MLLNIWEMVPFTVSYSSDSFFLIIFFFPFFLNFHCVSLFSQARDPVSAPCILHNQKPAMYLNTELRNDTCT